jgi:hypothetical protein
VLGGVEQGQITHRCPRRGRDRGKQSVKPLREYLDGRRIEQIASEGEFRGQTSVPLRRPADGQHEIDFRDFGIDVERRHA